MNAAHAHLLAAQIRGSGPRIVCLHSSTGSSAQWRRLQECLAPRWEVLAPDLHGHGQSPVWPEVARATLDVDAAAVALQIALRHPERVRSLTLYEPVLFGLLRKAAPADPALDEITEVAASVASLTKLGAVEDAARVFVGYWGGAEAWGALGDEQRRAVCQRMAAVPLHFEALFSASWDGPTLRRLRMPTLLMHGSQTRAPARRVSELLALALPQAQRVELGGAGHLGPLTHREVVVRWMLMHIDPHLAQGLSVTAG